MKTNTLRALLFMLCLTSLWACKHEHEEPSPIESPEKPTEIVSEVGNPEGLPTSATIGPDGGSLNSSDGRVTLTFPVGALSASTTITIQPISNTMPNGRGQAYRFMPDGQQFTKPVNLTIHYLDTDIAGTTFSSLGISYQNSKGVWNSMGGVIEDEANKTISKEIKHFSDWSLYAHQILYPENTTILPGESVELQIRVVDFYMPDIVNPDQVFPVISEKLVDARLIKSWKLNGQTGTSTGPNGSLSGSGNKVTYKAPSNPPAQNPVAVSAELDGPNGSKIILVSHITIPTKKWRLDLEWLRVNRCTPGSIASSTYTCSASVEFELDGQQKITAVKITNRKDALVEQVTSCNPTLYSATGKATGINLTGMEGGVDHKTGKLTFSLQGNWMDFPTYTLSYENGFTVITDESIETFVVLNTLTKMLLNDGETLDLRSSNSATDAGFIFKLNSVE